MEYTKKDLLKMKAKLIRYYNQERRYYNVLSFLRGTTLLFSSGAVVSFCMYLEKLFEADKAIATGAACGAVALTTGLSSMFVNKETKELEDEIFDYELKCPDELIEEAYKISRNR